MAVLKTKIKETELTTVYVDEMNNQKYGYSSLLLSFFLIWQLAHVIHLWSLFAMCGISIKYGHKKKLSNSLEGFVIISIKEHNEDLKLVQRATRDYSCDLRVHVRQISRR